MEEYLKELAKEADDDVVAPPPLPEKTPAKPAEPAVAISEEEGSTLESVFALLDTDGNGMLEKRELMSALQRQSSVQKLLCVSPKLSPLLHPGTFRKCFKQINTSSSGHITLGELKTFVESAEFNKLESLVLKAEETDVIRTVFDLIDSDKSGTLEKREVLRGMSKGPVIAAINGTDSARLKNMLKPANYRDAFMSITTETPGHITFSEFKAFSSLALPDPADESMETYLKNLADEHEQEEVRPPPPEEPRSETTATANEEWDRIYDEGSAAHYFQHKTSLETTWDVPEGYVLPAAEGGEAVAVAAQEEADLSMDLEAKIQYAIEHGLPDEPVDTVEASAEGEPAAVTAEAPVEGKPAALLSHQDESFYYQGSKEEEQVWDGAPPAAEVDAGVGEGGSANEVWDRIYDEGSAGYYFQHKETFETTWEVPDGFVVPEE